MCRLSLGHSGGSARREEAQKLCSATGSQASEKIHEARCAWPSRGGRENGTARTRERGPGIEEAAGSLWVPSLGGKVRQQNDARTTELYRTDPHRGAKDCALHGAHVELSAPLQTQVGPQWTLLKCCLLMGAPDVNLLFHFKDR